MDFISLDSLPPVVDQYDDNLALLVSKMAEVPSEFLSNTVDASTSAGNPTDFALMVKTASGFSYKYPCMDRGNTLVSSVYFEEYGSQLPQGVQKSVATKLTAAAESFGIAPSEGIVKTASGEILPQGPDDYMRKIFGFDEDAEFTEVEEAYKGLSPRGKRKMFMQVKTASAIGADYQGDTVGSDVYVSFRLREDYLKDNTVAVAALGNLKEKIAEVDPDLLADTLYAFDVKENITHLYGRRFPDAYASVFGSSMLKTAAPTSVTFGNDHYTQESIDDFASSGKDEIVGAFGEEFYAQFSDSPMSVLESLPITHRKALTRMMDARD